MAHRPTENDLKKFQSGKGVLKWQDKKQGATEYICNPLFLLVSPVGIEPTTY
jgi:hypothetical protein